MIEALDLDLSSYSPSEQTKNTIKDLPILMIVGPSGSGKDTVASKLVNTIDKFSFIVTHTTRSPRQNHGVQEVNGREYYFISKKESKKMLEDKLYIEAALIHGNIYGTSVSEFIRVSEEGRIPVSDIDVQGVESYKHLSNKAMAVFLLPPSFEVMLQRLAKRYGHAHNDEDIKTRLKTALFELNELLDKDYFFTVINDNLDKTIVTVAKIVETNTYDPDENKKALENAEQLISDIENYLAEPS